MGKAIITIRAGTEDFVVHETLIRSSSEFFNGALRHEWKEATQRVVDLPGVSSSLFEAYSRWLYTGKVFSIQSSPEKEGETEEDIKRGAEWFSLLMSYALGERLLDAHYKDAIIDACIEVVVLEESVCWTPSIVCSVYSNTPPESPLRGLLVDVAIWTASDDEMAQLSNCGYPVEFVVGLMAALSSLRRKGMRGKPPYKRDLCLYHEHKKTGMSCHREMS